MWTAYQILCLKRLGVQRWVKRPAGPWVSAPFVGRQQPPVELKADAELSKPQEPIRPFLTEAGRDQSKRSIALTQGIETRAPSVLEMRFCLVLQPLTSRVLLVAEAKDPLAPGLSSSEQMMLNKLCVGVQQWLGLENPPALVGESTIFRWPPSAHSKAFQLHSVQAATEALQGLLAAYKSRGFETFVVLSHHLSADYFAGGSAVHLTHSLQSLCDDPALKKTLWSLLKTVLMSTSESI